MSDDVTLPSFLPFYIDDKDYDEGVDEEEDVVITLMHLPRFEQLLGHFTEALLETRNSFARHSLASFSFS